jgi:hypothetical protein
MLWYKRQETELYIYTDFISFFKIAEKINKGEYKGLIHNESLKDISQIKLPGIEWLSADIADKEIVSIGSILTKTHDPQKPLDIVSFFKKDPEIILLYTDDIPFELVINSNKLKVIFSMMSSGPSPNQSEVVLHKIKKISSATHDFIGILRWFILTGATQGNKWFFIDEIGDKKDFLILGTQNIATQFYYKDQNNDLFMEEIEDVTKLKDPIQIPITFHRASFTGKKNYQVGMRFIKEVYPQKKLETEKAITAEHIKNIENIYPEQRGKQEYQEIESFYPGLPSWPRSRLLQWKYGK